MSLSSRIETNTQILRLLKTLKNERRTALPFENDLLRQWSSAGSVAPLFDRDTWATQREEQLDVIGGEAFAQLEASVTGSYYTPPQLIGALYSGLHRLGFTGGSVLEPAAGTGALIHHAPEKLRSLCQFTAIESCPVAGAIAQHTLPNAKVIVQAFEDVPLTGVLFDAVVANPPFSSVRKSHEDLDIRLSEHTFFLARALQALRPGGLMAAIVSRFFLDKKNPKERAFFTERARLLGAIRLPNTTFSLENTAVITDLIFFQRLEYGEKGNSDAWLDAIPQSFHDNEQPHAINRYFIDNPKQVLGHYAVVSGEGGRPCLTVNPVAEDLLSDIALSCLPHNIYQSASSINTQTDAVDESVRVADGSAVRVFGYTLDVDGQLVQRVPDRLDRHCFIRHDRLPATTEKRIRGMMCIRDAVRALLHAEREQPMDADLSQLRRNLNQCYDSFVSLYGAIHSVGNQRAFSDDPDYALLQSLEYNYDKGVSPTLAKREDVPVQAPSWTKAQLFNTRCSRPSKILDHFETSHDALLACVRDQGQIDLHWIASRLPSLDSVDAVVASLCKDNLIYRNPATLSWELAEAYLSGDVVSRLHHANTAAQHDTQYQRNVTALQQVQPEPIHPADIHLTLGASWTPPDILADFIAHLLEGHNMRPVKRPVLADATWLMAIPYSNRTLETQTLGTTQRPFSDLFPRIVNQKNLEVYLTHANGARYKDNEATLEVEAKANEIKQRWQDWVWSDPKRAQHLADVYNNQFNRWVDRSYDGRAYWHNPPPNMNPALTLRQHQANALWRGIQQGSALFSHPVGAGKTLLGTALTMELRRLGLAQRVVIVAPNHLLGVWRTEFARAYPSANILCASPQDMEKSKRGRLFARMLTHDWDAIILPMSSFEFIAVPPQQIARHINDQVSELLRCEQIIIDEQGECRSSKRLQKRRKTLQSKLETLACSHRQDDTLYWDELAPDALIVDEADLYKNLYFVSSHHNVVGLGDPSGSKRAFDMAMKVAWIRERQKGRGIYFLTGTPISNSLVELHTLFRYLAPERLSQCGLSHLDNWLRQYAIPDTRYELSATGVYKPVTAFRRFVNVPELLSHYRAMADSLSEEELKKHITLPDGRSAIPPLKDGTYRDIIAERSDDQAWYMAEILHRSQHLPADPHKDNFLKIMNDARLAALDMRLVNADAQDCETSKVNQLVDNVFDQWQHWQSERGTQIIFLDMSTPKAEFNVYDDIKKKLVNMGVPTSEIAFAQSAKTDIQTAALHKQVQLGQVRILLGSTVKLGAGVNVQDRMTALHLLDSGYRPRDAQQRIGRALRQGNRLYEANPDEFAIRIYRYGTALTLDALMYQINERKACFISQIINGTTSQRVIEDIDAAQASLAQMKAALSGNPLIVKHVELSMAVAHLESLERSAKRRLLNAQHNLAFYQSRLAQLPTQREALAADQQRAIEQPHAVWRDSRDRLYQGNAVGDHLAAHLMARFEMVGISSKPLYEGYYRGFPVILTALYEGVTLTISGDYFSVDLDFTRAGKISPRGIITRLNNVIAKLADGERELLVQQQEAKQQIPLLETIINSGFDQQGVLDSTREELQILTKTLSTLDTDDENHPVPTGLRTVISLPPLKTPPVAYCALHAQVNSLPPSPFDMDALMQGLFAQAA